MEDRANSGTTVAQVIRVAVISPVRVHLQGLAHLLEMEEGVRLVGTAPAVGAAQPLLAGAAADVVLLDMTGDMAGEPGLDALYRLAERTDVPCVVLGVSDRPDAVVACAEAGIAGYVTHGSSFTDLVDTLRSATRGEFSCQAGVVAGLVGRLAALARVHRGERAPKLTTRELQIVALIESGHANKEIARLLHIQLTTVKNHVHNVLEKLGVDSRGEVAAAVRRFRLPLPAPVPGSGSRTAPYADRADSFAFERVSAQSP
ncbi:response regulator transcription factor [Streptomyces sp. NPDC093970]|uniref:response regulator transcription factor n=1 Tax=Streptomyces sp. NPDC093970 TaxID=3155076 RepID=UPI0034416626